MRSAVRIHRNDNVAVAVADSGLQAGDHLAEFQLDVLGFVPQGHKVALTDIGRGDAVFRYGTPIGYAKRDIPAGTPVTEDTLRMPEPPDMDTLKRNPDQSIAGRPASQLTFEGYVNPDGTVGTKNLLGISTSVQCVAGIVGNVVDRIRRELLPLYPYVEGVVEIEHAYGCGVAIDAPHSEIPKRTLRNLGRNPNLGGELLAVGLGCEKMRPETLRDETSCMVVLQDVEGKGYAGMVTSLMKEAEVILERLNRRRREPRPLSDLVVGFQCGGSDAFSGITANPVLGVAADIIVASGGTVVFSEVTEVRDAIAQLVERAADEDVRTRLIEEMRWYDRYLDHGGVDRAANTTPGNKKGGLANIVEKAMGSVVKSGSMPISDVLSPGERLKTNGLVFGATPASDFVCGTLQAAAGVTLEVFTTGRGTPYSLPMFPVVKVASRSDLADKWHDLIDLDAGRIATGEESVEQAGLKLLQILVDVASGRRPTAAEKLNLTNDFVLFNPAPIT